jgi:hypothetical protein
MKPFVLCLCVLNVLLNVSFVFTQCTHFWHLPIIPSCVHLFFLLNHLESILKVSITTLNEGCKHTNK